MLVRNNSNKKYSDVLVSHARKCGVCYNKIAKVRAKGEQATEEEKATEAGKTGKLWRLYNEMIKQMKEM
jgi:hypothetical protein